MKQHQSIILFPNGAPNEPKKLEKEESEKLLGIKIAGTRVLGVSNVSEPSITFYPAPEKNNLGTTIIVVPGGGYNVLAYNLEGTEVCERFNRYGINCVLLKYRVPRREGLPKHQLPLHDLQQAIAYTRSHAVEWGIDENKIGEDISTIIGCESKGVVISDVKKAEKILSELKEDEVYSTKDMQDFFGVSKDTWKKKKDELLFHLLSDQP